MTQTWNNFEELKIHFLERDERQTVMSLFIRKNLAPSHVTSKTFFHNKPDRDEKPALQLLLALCWGK